MKEARHKDHILHDGIYMKCPEKAKLYRQAEDNCGKGLEMRTEINCNPHLIRVNNNSSVIPKLRLYASTFSSAI